MPYLINPFTVVNNGIVMQLKLHLGFAIIFALFFSVPAHSYEPIPFVKAKKWRFSSEISYFTTTANYDTEGSTFTKLPNNQSFTKTDVQINSYYSLDKQWNLLSGISFGHGKSVGANSTRNNSKVTDFQIGTSYLWETKPLVIIPHIYANIPFSKVDKDTDDVILNEGSLDLAPSIWISRRIFGFQFYADPGFLFRNGGRSHQFTLKVGLAQRFKSFELGAEYHLESAFTDDDTYQTPSIKQTVTNRVNAGSTKYYSVNPELHSAKVWANYRWSKTIKLQVGYDKTLNGKNTANGSAIFAGLSWDIDSAPPKEDVPKKNDNFTPEQEELEDKAKEYFDFDPEVEEFKKSKSR